MVLLRPVVVFEALREQDEEDVHARQEPILLVVILAGIASAILTPVWGGLLDDSDVDGVVAAVLTFIGGALNGAIDYYLLGLAVWFGLRSAGSEAPFRQARQLVGFAAAPIAVSLFVTLPVALIAYGGDFFRSGGSDEGTGRWIVVGLGLAFAAWALALLVSGLRVTFRLARIGVATALALATVVLAAVIIVPFVV
jgi:hypothetical protein